MADNSHHRVFLTQSSRSRSAEEAPTATSPSATHRLGRSRSGTAATARTTMMAASTAASRSRTATAAESIQRMATERQRRLNSVRQLAQLERASSEIACYGRRRFTATCDAEETPASPSTSTAAISKCDVSPYATVVMETTTPMSTPRPGSGERRSGQQRARLMNELRLRQAEQSVLYRHDRTAQELAQEGSLTSRGRIAASGYPWPLAYKYTPFPQPRLFHWLAEERTRAAEAKDAAAQVEEAEAGAEAESEEAEATEAVQIELAIQAPITLELPTLTLDFDHWPHQQQQQQQRKASDSLLTPSGFNLGPPGGSNGKWQRSKSQATVQKHQRSGRQFSVSTIGDEERSMRRRQLQSLAQVCQRLRNRRAGAAADSSGGDAVDQLVDEIECAAGGGGTPMYSTAVQTAADDQQVLPVMPCPGSEAKSRQHLTRMWLRRQRFCGTGPPPIIS